MSCAPQEDKASVCELRTPAGETLALRAVEGSIQPAGYVFPLKLDRNFSLWLSLS